MPRDPERIDPFLDILGRVWKKECPDWRFGQLITNVFNDMSSTEFYLSEDDRILEHFENYFKRKDDKHE